MVRVLVCAAVSVLLAGNVWAEDKGAGAAASDQPAKVETTTKEGTATKADTAVPEHHRHRGFRNDAAGHRGKVTKAIMENGVLKLTLDGKDYEFAVGDHTHAMLRTAEKDGKEVIVGVQMFNAEGRKGARTRSAKRTKAG